MSVLKRRMFQNGGQADSPAVNLQAYASNLNDGTKTAKEIFDAVNQYASTYGVSGLSLAEVEEIVEGKETPKVMAASLEFPSPRAIPVPTVDPVGLNNINIRSVDDFGDLLDTSPNLEDPLKGSQSFDQIVMSPNKIPLESDQFTVGGKVFTLTDKFINQLNSRSPQARPEFIYQIIGDKTYDASPEVGQILYKFASLEEPGFLKALGEASKAVRETGNIFTIESAPRSAEAIEQRLRSGPTTPSNFTFLFQDAVRKIKNFTGDLGYVTETAFFGVPDELPGERTYTDQTLDITNALKNYGMIEEVSEDKIMQQRLGDLGDAVKKELPIEEQVEEEDFVETPSAIFDPTQTIDIPFDPTKKEEPKVEERKEAKTYQPLVDPDLALDFLGAVGGKLVETGRVDLGLAGGAADAVTLRRQKEAAEAKARAEGATKTALKATDLKALRDSGQNINEKIKEYEGGRAGIRFIQEAINVFENAAESGEPIGGLPGLASELFDKLKAAFGANEAFKDLSARTQINKLIEVVRQGNIRDILGESGRTISNLDRDIIKDVFGGLKVTESPQIALTKLRKSLEKLQLANRARQGDIQDEMRFLQSPEFGTRGFDTILSKLSKINSVLADDPFAPYVATAATSYQPIVDIDL